MSLRMHAFCATSRLAEVYGKTDASIRHVVLKIEVTRLSVGSSCSACDWRSGGAGTEVRLQLISVRSTWPPYYHERWKYFRVLPNYAIPKTEFLLG
jgi:hypothetical protein